MKGSKIDQKEENVTVSSPMQLNRNLGRSPEMYSFLTKCRIENSYVREFFSEFIATFIFMLIGESSMVHLVIKKEHDILAVAFCWGIAVMMGLLTGGSNSGGHINPIVTTGFASLGKFPWIKVPHYVLGQHLGSFAAASLVHFNSLSLLNNYDRGSRVLLGTNGTGILLTTYPDMHVPTGILVLDTIICSGLLNFGIMVIVDKNNCNVPNYLHSLYVGLLVMAIVWALGANCMAGINPARDFPPRVLAVMVGYKDAFSYRNFWWIPLFMTHVGGTIGCYLYQITIGNHTPIKTAPIAEIRELKEFSAEPQGAKA